MTTNYCYAHHHNNILHCRDIGSAAANTIGVPPPLPPPLDPLPVPPTAWYVVYSFRMTRDHRQFDPGTRNIGQTLVP